MDFKDILNFVEENKKDYLAKELAENKKSKASLIKRRATVKVEELRVASANQGRIK